MQEGLMQDHLQPLCEQYQNPGQQSKQNQRVRTPRVAARNIACSFRSGPCLIATLLAAALEAVDVFKSAYSF